MKRIDSDALHRLYATLGLGGGGSPVPTELDDANVSQVLDIAPVVRRSRTIATQTGFYVCVFENDHAGAGTLTTAINPYRPAEFAVAPYPSPVPADQDFWVLSASMRRTAGAGALDGAFLVLNAHETQQGWGKDDSGAAVIANDNTALCRFTDLDTSLVGLDFGITADGLARVKIGLRIPLGAIISFRSDVDAAATLRMYLICGLFTAGLGQDVAQ